MVEKTPPAAAPAAPATEPAPATDVLSDAALAQIREIVAEAVRGEFDVLKAQVATADADPYGDAEQPLVKRTIRHDLFAYDLPGGGQAIARRGDTVDLMAHDVARGDKFEAFTGKVGADPDPPTASTLPAFPAEGSQAEQDAWMDSGTVPEIVATVNAEPSILTAVLAAEQRRGGEGRKSLLEALARMNSGD